MSFQLNWTPTALAQYEKLKLAAGHEGSNKQSGKNKAIGLFKQVVGCLQKLQSNPRHPGLQTHKFDSLENPFQKDGAVFEAYAQNKTPGAYRVFWCYGPGKGQITIIAITPHP
jgi:hypothetical protein